MADWTVATLNDFGRTRLSRSFYMRDFLFSDIAAVHGLLNAPDDPGAAIAAGKELCVRLLEPLQAVFGRVAIRSAFRSAEVNALGNMMQKAGKKGYNCASNEMNYARHIWDYPDGEGRIGATACIVLPAFVDAFPNDGDWTKLAWWIHDNLPYGEMEFFPTNWAFNLTWQKESKRTVSSFAKWRTPDGWKRSGYLTRQGAPGHDDDHHGEWKALADIFPAAGIHRRQRLRLNEGA